VNIHHWVSWIRIFRNKHLSKHKINMFSYDIDGLWIFQFSSKFLQETFYDNFVINCISLMAWIKGILTHKFLSSPRKSNYVWIMGLDCFNILEMTVCPLDVVFPVEEWVLCMILGFYSYSSSMGLIIIGGEDFVTNFPKRSWNSSQSKGSK
jgi:hypothetical protein